MYSNFFKRIIDFTLALTALAIFSPILLLLSVILAIDLRGNPFFTQTRPGKNERIFKLVKFKTMNDNKDNDGNYLPPQERLTHFGNTLRKLSLDELPQLINVIKGDMSLVGPRPLRVEYLPYYSKEQSRRHNVKPGITGWAQINGRNTLSWEDKFKYDVWYVDNKSFRIDINIIWLTFLKVLKREGINNTNENLVEPFKGIKLNG